MRDEPALHVAVNRLHVNPQERRVTPPKIKLTPTKVPIAQFEIDGHCSCPLV
jgi:hypothetical protein